MFANLSKFSPYRRQKDSFGHRGYCHPVAPLIRFLLPFLLLPFLSNHLVAEPVVTIIRVNDYPAHINRIQVDETGSVDGVILFDEQDSTDILLQFAWRRSAEETWHILPQTLPISPRQQRRHSWAFREITLGDRFDYHQSLDIVVFASGRSRPLPEGVVDFPTVLQHSMAISRQINIFRQSRRQSRYFVTPRIRIQTIAGGEARRDAIHDVGLQAMVSGEVRQPSASAVRLVVQPLNSKDFWVVDNEPIVRNGWWSAKADFTHEDFLEQSEFILYAAIIKDDLPTGERIPMADWRAYLKDRIQGVSPPMRVTRTEIPLAKNQIGLRILSIDNLPVDHRKRWEVRPRSGLKGMLYGRLISPVEAVWLLVADQFGRSQWRVLGRAAVKNKRYWELAPQVIGNSGEYLKIMAVIAKKDIRSLNQKQIDENVAYSATISVLTRDEPPLQVEISSIDRRRVGRSMRLKTEAVSAVEGRVLGRPIGEEEKVWIMKMPQNDVREWQLLGQAGFTNKHRWILPPMALGAGGEQIILIAVVSRAGDNIRDIINRGEVLATSNKIYLTLNE